MRGVDGHKVSAVIDARHLREMVSIRAGPVFEGPRAAGEKQPGSVAEVEHG